MLEEESSYSFSLLDHAVFRGFQSKEVQEHLVKWCNSYRGLASMRLEKFRFDRPFNSLSPADFLKDLVNSSEVRHAFPPIGTAARTQVVSDLHFNEVRTQMTSMDIFTRYQELGLVDATGGIRKMIPEYLDDMEIGDRVREVLILEESEHYGIFSALERGEFLFKLFGHLVLGGGLCQYEDNIESYIEHSKALYKDLVAVTKDQVSGEFRVSSRVYQIDNSPVSSTQEFTLFVPEHCQSFLYVVVDPGNRHVNLWWHHWRSAWG